MPAEPLAPEQAARIREYLLASNPQACIARELWSCSSGTYAAYRSLLEARRRQQQEAAEVSARRGTVAASNHNLPATVKYSFEGVKHVLADAGAGVTALSFASARNDLLAYGCADGSMWFVKFPAGQPPLVIKACRMHAQAVTAVDWSYDNSQLLSVALGGSLCVWDTKALADAGTAAGAAAGADMSRQSSGLGGVGAAAEGGGGRSPQAEACEVTCLRSIWQPTTSFLCGRFHRVNFSLAMVGTSGGAVELHNCNTGWLDSRYQVAGVGAYVTAIDVSNHHVFVGDSAGVLHLLACELHKGQLSSLRPTTKLRLAHPTTSTAASLAGGHGTVGGAAITGHQLLAGAAITVLQYVPFCRATDTAVIMAGLQDGSLCVVKTNEARHTAELHLRRSIPAPAAAAAASFPHRSAPSHTGGGPSSPADMRAAAAASAASASAAIIMRLRPSICPLSVIHDVPLITYGGEDTTVYIVDVTARSYAAAGGRGGGASAAATAASAAAAAAANDRPLTVTALKAHRAPVTCVAWSHDEVLLASADADGTVVLWQRSRLF